MSTMDIIIFKVRLKNVTTAVSSLLNSLAKDQRIRNGLHRGLNDVVNIKIDCSENGCKNDHPYMKQNI